MRRRLGLLGIPVAAVAITVAAASTLALSGPDSPRAGGTEATGCDLGNVYFHPVATVDGDDHWAYWRLETSAFDAEACAGSEVRAKVAWDSDDPGLEPDGYYYLRMPTDENLNKPTIVGATILGVFGDAVDDICDPFNCYEVDSEGHYVIRYVYSDPSYDPAYRIDALPDVAGHHLGDADWIVVAADAPLEDF